MSVFPIIYKKTSKGQPQQWQIVVEDNTFYTIEGIVNGKLTQSLPTICSGKNIGRSNETTPEQQALAEAKAKHQKKLDKGYAETLEASGAQFFEPMLAKDADKKSVDFKVRTFVQPKLDGLRCINENNSLTSRNGKPYVACPHLYQNVARLDGELYTHEYKDDFNKIVSLCKKQKPTDEDLLEASQKVEFWMYDYPDLDDVFSERYKALDGFLMLYDGFDIKHKFRLVPTYEVFSWEDIDNYHAQFMAEGYEGTIIRLDLGPYENKRSKQLLKYKDFTDEEFEIVGYEEGTGGRAGTIGYFWIRLDKTLPYTISDTNPINCCKSNVKGDFSFLKQVLANAQSYVGTDATVKYFNKTPAGALRFPYIIKLNRAEYE